MRYLTVHRTLGSVVRPRRVHARKLGISLAAIIVVGSVIPGPVSPEPANASSSVAFTATYGTSAGTLDAAKLINGSQGGYSVARNLHYVAGGNGMVSAMGLRQVRLDHIFDARFYSVVSRSAAGALVLDFTKLDSVVLPIFASGMTPWFTLSYTPSALGGSWNAAPTSLSDWSALVSATVAHYKNLGHTGLNWEVWNEPDLGQFWTSGNVAYQSLYAASASAVKSADSTAQVGGPAVSSIGSSMMSSFLDYIAANPTVPLDFVTWHDYGGTDFSSASTVATMLSSRNISPRREYITEWNSSAAFGTTPGGDADTNTLASYAARRLTSALSQPSLSGVFYFSPLEGWNATADFSTDLGLMTVDGHRKAVGNVFDMMNLMPRTILTSTISGAPADRSVGVVATGDPTVQSVAFLAWNDGTDSSSYQLTASSLPFGASNFKVTRYDVDATNGNYYSDWAGGLRNLSTGPDELLRPSSVSVSAPATSWSSSFVLNTHSVALYVLTPTSDGLGTQTVSTPVATTNIARGGPVTSLSTYTGGGWSPANLVDGRRHTFDSSDTGSGTLGFTSDAHSSATATEWVQVDLGASKAFDTVSLWPRDDQAADGASFPVDFTIAGSSDGSTWTNLVSRSGYSVGSKVSGPQVFSTALGSYRYVRLTATRLGQPVTESNSQVYRLQLAELEVANVGLPNPGFETGDLTGWSIQGGASVDTANSYEGRYAATFTGTGHGVSQTITGLSPNTTYEFGGFLKSAADGDPVYVGVKNYGGPETATPVFGRYWKQAWVKFTTGPSATTALVYVYKNSGTTQSWFDDAMLVRQ